MGCRETGGRICVDGPCTNPRKYCSIAGGYSTPPDFLRVVVARRSPAASRFRVTVASRFRVAVAPPLVTVVLAFFVAVVLAFFVTVVLAFLVAVVLAFLVTVVLAFRVTVVLALRLTVVLAFAPAFATRFVADDTSASAATMPSNARGTCFWFEVNVSGFRVWGLGFRV